MFYAQVWPERGQRIQHLAANEQENELFEIARAAPAGDMRGAVANASTPASQTQPTPRPRAFDASEGTRLDPLLNKTYDLSYAKVIPSDIR